jgi:hypothetical protein
VGGNVLARKEVKDIGQIVDIMEKLSKFLASLHYRYLFLKLFLTSRIGNAKENVHARIITVILLNGCIGV